MNKSLKKRIQTEIFCNMNNKEQDYYFWYTLKDVGIF